MTKKFNGGIRPHTNRKLSDKKVLMTTDELIRPDEEFWQIPKYPKYFVSQYARIISTNGIVPRMLKQSIDKKTKYSIVKLSKRGKSKSFRVHILVAKVWLDKPEFWLDDILEVHHVKKILMYNTLKAPKPELNYAENLLYVYKCYHSIEDKYKYLKIKKDGFWTKVKDIKTAAECYHVSTQIIYEVLSKKPIGKEKEFEYYCDEVMYAGEKIQIIIELKKYKQTYKQKNRTFKGTK